VGKTGVALSVLSRRKKKKKGKKKSAALIPIVSRLQKEFIPQSIFHFVTSGRRAEKEGGRKRERTIQPPRELKEEKRGREPVPALQWGPLKVLGSSAGGQGKSPEHHHILLSGWLLKGRPS